MRTARQMISEFQKRGEEARRTKAAADAAYNAGLRDQSAAQYQDLLDAFNSSVRRALPSGTEGFNERLAAGEYDAIETAIAFLEADPWFFSSGYEKQNLIRFLKRVPLSDAQTERLRAVVLTRIDGHGREEFRHYGRLAVALVSEAFVAGISARVRGDKAGPAQRAQWVLNALRSAGKI